MCKFLPSQTLIATIIFCSLQVHSSGVASWSLKELTQEFYGLTIAYEEVRPVLYYIQPFFSIVRIYNQTQCHTACSIDGSMILCMFVYHRIIVMIFYFHYFRVFSLMIKHLLQLCGGTYSLHLHAYNINTLDHFLILCLPKYELSYMFGRG